MSSAPSGLERKLMHKNGEPQKVDEGPSSFGHNEGQKPLVIGPPFLLIEEEEEEKSLASHFKTSLSLGTKHVALSHGLLTDGAKSHRNDARLFPTNNAQPTYSGHPTSTSQTQMMDGGHAEVKREDRDARVNENKSGTLAVSTMAYPETTCRIVHQDSLSESPARSVDESLLGPLPNLTRAHERFFYRNLPPAYRFRMLGHKLNGVIMGCTNQTKEECMRDLVFGLPAKHWEYVQAVEHGTTVYLFNYSKRCLHGIFKAVGGGQWKLKPYGWSNNSNVATKFPAQIRVEVVENCPCLYEAEYGAILRRSRNYVTSKKMSFELDLHQVNALNDLFHKVKNSRSKLEESSFLSTLHHASNRHYEHDVQFEKGNHIENEDSKECLELHDCQPSNVGKFSQRKPQIIEITPHPLARPSSKPH